METKYNPDYSIHPGDYLAEVLESRAMSQSEFAQRTGLAPKTINHILSGKSSFSTDVALIFERTLGISANIWIGLLENYHLFHARKEERKKLNYSSYEKWLKQFPLKDLTKLGLIRKTKVTAERVEDLMRFLNIASPDAWKQVDNNQLAYYRKNSNFKDTNQATAVWLHLAKRLAERQLTHVEFSKENLERNLSQIRKLTAETQDVAIARLNKICFDLGLKLVLLPEFKDTHLSGAAFWAQSSPIVALSLRHKRNDHFWFSFFHEVGHILKHGKKSIFLDSLEGTASDITIEEEEANQFASQQLIAESDWDSFKMNFQFSDDLVQSFAKKIEIHPGIIVGRLQREGLLPYSRLNELKEKWEIEQKEIQL
ncbi:HigA family addiction module antitoxin [Leptospira bandrabouensis]|uniref:HigA family addiction module antitoxin n=1 Tax=Leptospira bandrabouensis TaxID=2484903 RepID=UPI001EE9C100|nr:HigA family addiction module antitoxin [Leptospira bandrabouensis]MCG6146137.1 HigA family addiction module antidote protein [Leptospira bandrabouensis]MCG6165724.1 HigA family addiction module antidote protein [Leptospira bandrabouensis]